MASGWNLWVWLQCIGVASGCCCKEVYSLTLIINFLYSTCISSFLGSSIPTSLFIFKMFFRSFINIIYIILPLVKQTCGFPTFVFRPLPICQEGLSLADIIKMQKGRSKLQA